MENAEDGIEYGESQPKQEHMVVVDTPDTGANEGVQGVTFMGNTYDLLSVVSVVTGGLVLVSCLTCNMGYYCLPLVPIVLGLVGVLSAHQSVNMERTRLLSWLGVASGGILLLLLLAAVAMYVGFVVLMITMGGFE
jgi:hypothetical protein